MNNHRKYKMRGLIGLLVNLLLFSLYLGLHKVDSFTLVGGKEAPLNCSQHCMCSSVSIQHLLSNHLQRHRAFMGTEYRSEPEYSSKYVDFLGIYAFVVNQIIDIKCNVNTNERHPLSSLLNGIDHLNYVSVDVTCRNGEEIVWDVPTWQISLNAFTGKNCKLMVPDDSKKLIIPMNMWIFEANNCGPNLLNLIDIRFTTNTMVLSVTGAKRGQIPDNWKGDFMISATSINLQKNDMTNFTCTMSLIKNLDTINLSRNRLSSFPGCMIHEKNEGIRFVSLSHNYIDDISALFEDKPAKSFIEILDLSNNLITEIGTFQPLHKLTILDLSKNRITEINDDAFQNLIDLKELRLQFNRIHYIGSVAFRNNIGLSKIYLNNNHLKTLRTEQFPSTENEVILDVRRNKLSSPPFSSCSEMQSIKPSIKVFSAHNPYHCNCDLTLMEECFNYIDSERTIATNHSDIFRDKDEFKCASPLENVGKFVKDLTFVKRCVVETDCPQSCSCHLNNKDTIDVNCTSRRLLELPETIPTQQNATTRLFLSNNPLQMLSYHSYLSNLSELHIDNCLLASVTPLAIAALQNVKILALHNNRLQRLPSNTKNITLKKASNVTLHNNRWTCSCDSLWLPLWITKHKSVLWTPGNIVCSYLNKPVEEFTATDVDCSHYTRSEVLLAMSLAFVSMVTTVYMLYNYGEELNMMLYSKLGMRMRLNLSYGDRFNPYDAYVSYGEDSYKWVVDTLVPHLEEGPKKYKLCLHYRDFPSDMSVVENIPWAIKLSRCSILILSKEFMKKEWRILDIRSIFQRLLMVANRLVIIVTDDLSPEEVSPDLRAYMNTHEYLRTSDTQFWDKLDMFLPPKSPMSDDGTTDADVTYGGGCGDFEQMTNESVMTDSDRRRLDKAFLPEGNERSS